MIVLNVPLPLILFSTWLFLLSRLDSTKKNAKFSKLL